VIGLLLIGVVSAALAAGVYLYGRDRQHRLAVVGLVATLVLGLVLGLLVALFVGLAFVVAIWASSRERPA
jgi:hypothetical protein